MRSRVMFETDVGNDYFTRGEFQGKMILRPCDQDLANGLVPNNTFNLQSGVATLNLALPTSASVGDA